MALKWFKNALCEEYSFRELDALTSKVAPGCNGLTFLPYLCGSIMPKYNPLARGSFTGLTPEHTRGHFVRSIMEAVACMLKETACLGSAILVGTGTGVFRSVDEACEKINTEKIFTPQNLNYSEVYKRYIDYDTVLNTVKRI